MLEKLISFGYKRNSMSSLFDIPIVEGFLCAGIFNGPFFLIDILCAFGDIFTYLGG